MTADQIKAAHAAIIERETNIIRMINHWDNNEKQIPRMGQLATAVRHSLAPHAPSTWPVLTLEHLEPSGVVHHLPRTRRRG